MKTDNEMWEEYRFECEGHDGDYVVVEWDNDDPEWRSVSVDFQPKRLGFFGRIRCAFKWLTCREHLWGSIMLDERTLDKLIEALKEMKNDVG